MIDKIPVQPLHVHLLRISRKPNECIAAYLQSDISIYRLPEKAAWRKLLSLKDELLTQVNSLLVLYKHDFLVSNHEADYSSR